MDLYEVIAFVHEELQHNVQMKEFSTFPAVAAPHCGVMRRNTFFSVFLCRSFTTLISENIVFLFPENLLVFRE